MNNLGKEDNFEIVIQLVTEKLKAVKVYGNEDSEKQDFIAIDDVGLAELFTDVIIELINELVENS
jgi:nucleoside-triphosphatase THEP1